MNSVHFFLNFLDKTLRRISESKDDDKIRRISPSSSLSSAKSKQIGENYCCCSLCRLDHEARDSTSYAALSI